jgi:DNA-binding GntR family transcriptional regulator
MRAVCVHGIGKRQAGEITRGDGAAELTDWEEVETARVLFHEILMVIHHISRISRIFFRLVTVLRLEFLAAKDPADFHSPFLTHNSRICDRMAGRWPAEARGELVNDLDDVEEDAVRAVRE